MTDKINVLPDGSAFFTASLPLPTDHWLYADHPNEPPMGMKVGTDDPTRRILVEHVRAAAQYAIRCATTNGTEPDYDPDSIVQNMVVGLLGYFTHDGDSHA